MVARIIGMTNACRRNKGLADHTIHAALTAVAQARACDMAARNDYSHTGAEGSQPMERLHRAGHAHRQVAENLASARGGAPTLRQVSDGWRKSPGHNASPPHRVATDVGLAIATQGGRTYWVMVFARPC